jgi:hypothetical protein
MRTPTLTVAVNAETNAEFARLHADAIRQLMALPLPVPTFLQAPQPPTADGYRRDFTAEIEAGVELLDATLGRGTWIHDVNLGALDLGNEDLCLVAQLARSTYSEGVVRLGGPDVNRDDVNLYEPYEWGERYGFAVPEELCNRHGGFRLYAQLTDQWVAKIGQLRAEVTA